MVLCINEFFYGTISGVSQIFVGYPLDTLKTRIQCLDSKTINMKNFTNGMNYSLMSSVITNSIVFGVNGNLKNMYSIENTALTGFLSGMSVSPFIYLFDVGKIKRQLGTSSSIPYVTLLKKSNGLYTTFLRESVAFSIYFYVYDRMKERNISTPLSGGIAGVMNWLITYPLDVIRNRQIAYNITFVDAYYNGSLYNGIGVCLIRAFIVNSFGFFAYDFSKSTIESLKK